jgi:hypothetical protein
LVAVAIMDCRTETVLTAIELAIKTKPGLIPVELMVTSMSPMTILPSPVSRGLE